jgi:glycosyltransferase involved in cell wall biosynthesis
MTFDSVYILAFDGWSTELRSNRWHYATRLARRAPVVIVQPKDARAWVAPSARPDPRNPAIEVLDASMDWNDELGFRKSARLASDVGGHMKARGHAAPLLWTYDPRLAGLLAMLPAAARVFHATENYFDFEGLGDDFLKRLRACLQTVDVILAVSEGAAAAYRAASGRDVLVSTNGCDHELFAHAEPDPELAELARTWSRVAVYGGNINARVDFRLIQRLALAHPETLIALYGPIVGLGKDDDILIERLRVQSNVVFAGTVDPDRLPAIYKAADLGIIPYRHDRFIVENGFPLKTFEMIAAGLPVVSTLMRPLLPFAAPWLRIASNEDAFLADAASLSRRTISNADCEAMDSAARFQDYDRKFESVVQHIEGVLAKRNRAVADLSHFFAQVGYEWGPDKEKEIVEVVKTRFETTREALIAVHDIFYHLFRGRGGGA